MKKPSRGIFVLWMLIAAAATAGTFIISQHLGAGTAVIPGSGMATNAQPDAETDTSATAAAGTVAPSAVPMQNFSNDGYSFAVPASWKIEQTGTDTVALHPDAASSAAACKIEVAAFPFSEGADEADWIAHRIGADPSVAVIERSSGAVSLASGTAIEWTGTIDALPTTLVYAFNDSHAYEIAPSVIGEDAGGSAQCGDMLQEFLSALTI